MNIIAWNVRGLNKSKKQKAVKDFLLLQKSGVICLFEHKIKKAKEKGATNRMFFEWNSYFNSDFNDKGRIWLTWDRRNFAVDILDAHAQWVHCKIKDHSAKKTFLITFVYAYNKREERVDLWDAIARLATSREPCSGRLQYSDQPRGKGECK